MVYMPIKPIANKKEYLASIQDAMDKYYKISSPNKSNVQSSVISESTLNNNTEASNNSFNVNDNNYKDDGNTNKLVAKSDRDKLNSKLTDKLREAVIWSEILGKPMCKRRKRR